MTANELYFVDLVEFTQPNGSSEEYFFIVADSKRKEDVGSLLHIVGSGTPQLYLNITENFCPARQNTYKSRVCLGYVRSVTDFVNIVNFAPLCVTLQNTKIDKAIYRRWKKDMVREAIHRHVLITWNKKMGLCLGKSPRISRPLRFNQSFHC